MTMPLLATIAFLLQGQTTKKLAITSPCKQCKNKTLKMSCPHRHAFRLHMLFD